MSCLLDGHTRRRCKLRAMPAPSISLWVNYSMFAFTVDKKE